MSYIIHRIIELVTIARDAEESCDFTTLAFHIGWLKGFIEVCEPYYGMKVDFGGDNSICEWVRIKRAGCETYYTYDKVTKTFELVPFI